MSLVAYKKEVQTEIVASVAETVFQSLPTPVVSVASVASVVFALMVVLVTMRGGLGLVRDVHRLLSYLLKKKLVEKEVQTEPYFPVLPEVVFFNKKSDVFHIEGCHHIGPKAESKSACTLCKHHF